ncbi:hypothetical protein PMI05_02693 [Brevibacillus sp. BC25]|nr:hypothetical protein PMI05_02693 [Brevibacillus sp. BC25]
MQKAKHAFKRPPMKHILNGLLWTRFRFLHGGGQSIPQRVALEAGAFSLLFPPHHYSNNLRVPNVNNLLGNGTKIEEVR